MTYDHYVVCEPLRGGHLPTGLGALGKDLGAELAVVVVVLFAFLGARFASVGARVSELAAVLGVTGHEPRMERRDVGNVPTQADALGHAFPPVGTRVGAPLADRGGFEAVLDALLFLVAQVVDLGDGVCERHYTRWSFALTDSGSADIRKATSKGQLLCGITY